MATYLLIWNPEYYPWDDIADAAQEIKRKRVFSWGWSTGSRKSIQKGDRLFLIRLGKAPKGIMASGWATSDVYPDTHWNNSQTQKEALYVDIDFDRILVPGIDRIINIDLLENHPVLKKKYWHPRGSGSEIPDDVANELEEIWKCDKDNNRNKSKTIDRENVQSAQEIAEKLLPDAKLRKNILHFLSNAICYANELRADNWNINLDKNGKFIRFNVGQEYCITIYKKYSLVLVLKEVLNFTEAASVKFQGHQGKKKIISSNLRETPDCLAKVPDSVGCLVSHEHIVNILPSLEEANRRFIDYAIRNTKITPLMRRTHSPGLTAYLSQVLSSRTPDPVYTAIDDDYREQEQMEKEVRKLSIHDLEEKIKNANRCIESSRLSVTVLKFERNLYIAEYTKRKANGICCDCKQHAPFISKSTNEPFLETHHIVPLAQGGADTIENTVALCPNCHRKRHHG
ncbi:HNH endonuclease [Candidatus Electronema sp. JC]|uniref:HNH endonuclease n=1 Tax=Candidatus Electronema sp. JC TaxID=3401570 RepID=UPI003B437860